MLIRCVPKPFSSPSIHSSNPWRSLHWWDYFVPVKPFYRKLYFCLMMHTGSVFVAGIHQCRTWMSGFLWQNTGISRRDLSSYSHGKDMGTAAPAGRIKEGIDSVPATTGLLTHPMGKLGQHCSALSQHLGAGLSTRSEHTVVDATQPKLAILM